MPDEYYFTIKLTKSEIDQIIDLMNGGAFYYREYVKDGSASNIGIKEERQQQMLESAKAYGQLAALISEPTRRREYLESIVTEEHHFTISVTESEVNQIIDLMDGGAFHYRDFVKDGSASNAGFYKECQQLMLESAKAYDHLVALFSEPIKSAKKVR